VLATGSQQLTEDKPLKQDHQQHQLKSLIQQQRPSLPTQIYQATAPSASFSSSSNPSISASDPSISAFPSVDGGYEPDEALKVTKKNRKKGKEQQVVGDTHASSNSSRPAPSIGDISKPPRFRKSDPPPQQLEAAQGFGSKPSLQISSSNSGIGSAVTHEFAAIFGQAFRAARCSAP
jgi:hypothetical protein